MRRILLFVLLTAGCSREITLRRACEKGDPAACQELSADFAARTMAICAQIDAASPACPQPVPLVLPKAASSGDSQIAFTVVLAADGTTQVDGKSVANDDTILSLAQDARVKNPGLRAVIKADTAVPHGRVIHVLDLLKQAQVSRIAFGTVRTAP